MGEFKNFKCICEKVSSLPCTNDQLNLIKDHFRKAIDSARRFDSITNLSDLVKLLKKRDVLNKEDTNALKQIAIVLHRNDIIQMINSDYENNLQQPLPFVGTIPRLVLPRISNDPIKRVDDIICLEIGQKWNDLARNLYIPEGFIDELEHTHRRISDMTREILIYHRENCDERYWKVKLCEALQKARRKDLCYKVQGIFALYGLM